MKTLTTLDLNKITPYAVGFDRIISDMFQYAENNVASTGYPPYNIRKEGDKFQIEIALAGVTKDDLEITAEGGKLTISHDPEETSVDVESASRFTAVQARQSARLISSTGAVGPEVPALAHRMWSSPCSA